MLAIIKNALYEVLEEVLSSDEAKRIIDKWLDKVEDYIKNTDTKWDDRLILPLIKKLIREPYNIEDND